MEPLPSETRETRREKSAIGKPAPANERIGRESETIGRMTGVIAVETVVITVEMIVITVEMIAITVEMIVITVEMIVITDRDLLADMIGMWMLVYVWKRGLWENVTHRTHVV